MLPALRDTDRVPGRVNTGTSAAPVSAGPEARRRGSRLSHLCSIVDYLE